MEDSKPGVMLFFDLIPTLEMMSNEERGELLWAVMNYAKNSTKPDFKSSTTKIVWSMLKSRIEQDDERYKNAVLKRRYAGYVSGQKRRGREESVIMSFEEWLAHIEQA